MSKHTAYHCISCHFFDEHIYDKIFLEHECQYNEEEVQEEQIIFCPECNGRIETDEDSGEEYCPECGLVVRGPYSYTAGIKIDYPYGLKI